MAATTPQLGLVTPTQGDLTGTWGNTVNNGITEYTDIAIAGTLTLTGDGVNALLSRAYGFPPRSTMKSRIKLASGSPGLTERCCL